MSSLNLPHATMDAGPKLFISYRRADSASVAGRIYDRLTAYFGREALFKDVDNIPIGANFEQVIAGVIEQCSVALVLVGPTWATIATEHGPRLDNPQDVVRLEVEAALRRGVPVIPVLVEGASMPDPATLSPSLRPLFARGTMQARNDPWFDGDMSQLATTLGAWLPLRSAGAVAPAASGSMPPPVAGRVATGTMLGRAGRTQRRRNRLASPLGLAAIAVLVVAVSLLSLAGAGLAGAGPFGALGASTTPLATAPLQATATPTPVEQVVLNESLTHAQPGWESDSECGFQSDGYHAHASAGNIVYCLSPASYTNFHLRTQVHVATGVLHADYVLLFRVSDSGDFDYVNISFNILPGIVPTAVAVPGAPTPTVNYAIQASWSVFSHSNGVGAVLGEDLTPAAHVTGDGDNTLEVYADGPNFTILVNGTQLGSFHDANNNQAGKIGLGAETGEAIYTSISVATLAA
ncbi:MAG: TIR domain-containing protein [Ktedonobacterales bacterium]